MNNMDIVKKLQEYDEAFDFYLNNGHLPPNIQQGDLLGDYIKRTIDDNPQLESQDSLWKELLKEELMRFLEAMLQLFEPIEENHRREKELNSKFANGSIEQKRLMWK